METHAWVGVESNDPGSALSAIFRPIDEATMEDNHLPLQGIVKKDKIINAEAEGGQIKVAQALASWFPEYRIMQF